MLSALPSAPRKIYLLEHTGSNVNSFSNGREASMQYKLAGRGKSFSLIDIRLLVLCVMHSSNISIHTGRLWATKGKDTPYMLNPIHIFLYYYNKLWIIAALHTRALRAPVL